MPTGYTADLAEGKDITFKQFVLTCARAFGATIEMRDEPMDKEIPTFTASDYNAKRLKEIQEQQRQFDLMSLEETKLLYDEECRLKRESIDKSNKESDAKAQRYNDMMKKVQDWQPPTNEHIGLRDFMLNQLQQSKDWDCSHYEYTPISFEKWYIAKKEGFDRDIAYHTEENQKEIDRTAERNKWVKELKESLV